MDALSGLLDGPRARGAFLLRALFDPPWSLLVRDRAPLTLITVVRGRAWLTPDTGEAHPLHANDTAVVRGPDPYTVADPPETPHQAVIHPGQHCTTLRGHPLAETMNLGVRTWGNSPDATTVLLVGAYPDPGTVGRRLLTALPPLTVLSGAADHRPLIPLLAQEISRTTPGQATVLDRLLDLLLITALRTRFSHPDQAPAWYRASHDPVVGRALTLLHSDPARAWTVSSLAEATGVARATLARRFTALVGEPPMAYLTGWRLTLAADLLRDPDTTIEAAAHATGYGSASALSAAFKRAHGTSPDRYRRLHNHRRPEEPLFG